MEKKSLAFVWVVIQIILTAVLILLTKYVLNLGIEPLNFSYQILFASAIYLGIYALIKEPNTILNVNKKSLFYIMLVGLIGGGIAYSLGFLGMQKSSAVNYSFLIQTTVFFTPVLAYFFLKEHLKSFKLVLIIALLGGAYLVSTSGKLIFPKTSDLLIILSAIAFSIGVIIAKITLRNVPTITFSMYRGIFGGIFIFLFLIIINKVSFDVNWFWIAIIGLVIAGGTLAMYKVLEYATASYMQMMYISVPVVTAILAYLILGELMNTFQIIGGTVIILSGFFVHKLNI